MAQWYKIRGSWADVTRSVKTGEPMTCRVIDGSRVSNTFGNVHVIEVELPNGRRWHVVEEWRGEYEPEYSVVDIMEYIRLLHRRARGLDGPIVAQWRGVERYLEPFISE